jgi:hypothetical protein
VTEASENRTLCRAAKTDFVGIPPAAMTQRLSAIFPVVSLLRENGLDGEIK